MFATPRASAAARSPRRARDRPAPRTRRTAAAPRSTPPRLHVGKPMVRPRRSPSTTVPESMCGRPSIARRLVEVAARDRVAHARARPRPALVAEQRRATASRSRAPRRGASSSAKSPARPWPKRKFCPTMTTCAPSCSREHALGELAPGVCAANAEIEALHDGHDARRDAARRARACGRARVSCGGHRAAEHLGGCGENVSTAALEPARVGVARGVGEHRLMTAVNAVEIADHDERAGIGARRGCRAVTAKPSTRPAQSGRQRAPRTQCDGRAALSHARPRGCAASLDGHRLGC